MAKDCKMSVKCECNSDKYVAALHPGPPLMDIQSLVDDRDDSGEQSESSPSPVTSKCTEVCGNADGSRSCSKICLDPEGTQEKAIKMYAVLDEQSNKSLAKTEVPLPPLIECDMVPDDRTEIPSPEVAHHHPHLRSVAGKILPVDKDVPILLLLGRDILRLHKVREQINGPHNAPYAQQLEHMARCVLGHSS